MTIRSERKEAIVERMADHLLAEGLGAATLRPMAEAVGTSDRMLLYYFADKDELLVATLTCVAARMVSLLDEAVPEGRLRPFATLLAELWTALASDALKQFMHLWLDLASGAARGLQPHLNVARTIADGFLIWVTRRLRANGESTRGSSAALFLATVEGILFLEAVGRRDISDAAVTEIVGRKRKVRTNSRK